MNNLNSLAFFWPELILSVTILAAVIADLFYQRKDSHKVAYWSIGGLILAYIAIRLQSAAPMGLFMDTVALDPFSQFFKILILLSTIIVMLISFISGELKEYRLGEYFSIMTIMTFGLFLMSSSIDMLMVYLSIEIVSIMSFFLAGYLKRNSSSNEASLKYVIYGAFSSGIMLYGFSLLFGLTGSTNFFEMQSAIAALGPESNLALVLATVFILVGFGYKISAVPFHFWTPDVYEGSPTTITAYLSVAPKAAGFALLIRFFNQIFGNMSEGMTTSWSAVNDLPWPELIAILSAATMTLGNLVAIQQNNVKRMLAYSSIAHAGYMMMALPIMSNTSIEGIMMYLIMYLFMNLGAFFVVIYVNDQIGGEEFSHFDGLGWRMPIVGIAMTLFMVALTGLPPTAGFVGKFYIFAAVIEAGSKFYWLAFVGVINSVVSLYYYIRVVKHMYLSGERSDELVNPSSKLALVILLVLAIPSFVFGWYFSPVAEWISRSTIMFQGM